MSARCRADLETDLDVGREPLSGAEGVVIECCEKEQVGDASSRRDLIIPVHPAKAAIPQPSFKHLKEPDSEIQGEITEVIEGETPT